MPCFILMWLLSAFEEEYPRWQSWTTHSKLLQREVARCRQLLFSSSYSLSSSDPAILLLVPSTRPEDVSEARRSVSGVLEGEGGEGYCGWGRTKVSWMQGMKQRLATEWKCMNCIIRQISNQAIQCQTKASQINTHAINLSKNYQSIPQQTRRKKKISCLESGFYMKIHKCCRFLNEFLRDSLPELANQENQRKLMGCWIIIYQMISTILDVAFLLRAKLSGNELDLALIAATNDDNWQAAPALLHAISSAAYSHEKWTRVNEFLSTRLRNSSRWKKVLKALNVVEFLLKNGPGFAVDDLKRELAFFKALESFQAEEQGVDRGASIRERARVVAGLLENEALLEDERASAKLIRERMSHVAGTTSFSSEGVPQTAVPKYESFDSKSFAGSEDNKAFYNYGSGNYGDREEDAQHQQEDVDRKAVQRTGGQMRVREIVPIVNLDIKQRKVENNPLYEVFQKRIAGQSLQGSAGKASHPFPKDQKSLKPIIKAEIPVPKSVSQAKPQQSGKKETQPEAITRSEQFLKPNVSVAGSAPAPQLPNLLTEGLTIFNSQPADPPPAIPPSFSSLGASFAELSLLQFNPFADPQTTSSSQTTEQSRQSDQSLSRPKNGAGLEVQKIVWLSNKEKNLTDLNELSLAPRAPSQGEKKEFTNNIKIDPWAW